MQLGGELKDRIERGVLRQDTWISTSKESRTRRNMRVESVVGSRPFYSG